MRQPALGSCPRTLVSSSAFALLLIAGPVALAQEKPWAGEWITDLGAMRLEQSGDKVTGSYGKSGSVDGAVNGGRFRGNYQSGNASGKAEFELADDSASFSGKWVRGRQSGVWRGWRKDPQATDRATADFSGVWLSSLGVLQLKQDGDKVSGSYGAEGWSSVEGTVEGARLNVTWKRLRWSGPAWLEQTPDGERIFGLTEEDNPNVWLGVRLKGFERHAPAKAGEVVEGRADNGMLYSLRMPDDWRPGQPTDVVVLLHGSNWTTRGMVPVTAKKWPEIGQRFAILGIQGQNWASWSDPPDLRFNYTYVNWMGRSTYKGYPNTDRESPYLVMQVIDELDEEYSFGRVLVGGHSQGAYLTYVLHMHFPEKLAGTFPIAGGLIIQAEPDVFDDEELQRAQRATPMAIVHGRRDQVVRYSTGEYNYRRFKAFDFHRTRFFNPRLGHAYDFLPIGEAVAYLDAMSTSDQARLLDFALEQVEEEDWRTVGAVIQRAKEIKAGGGFSPVWRAYERAAAKHAKRHLKAIQANQDGEWVDDFLAWHGQFALSQAGAEAVAAFQALRDEHDEPANQLKTDARKAFRSGKRDEGWAKYQEIVDQYYASRIYATTKNSLTNR